MALVAGVDSSTQSCKVVIVDASTGAIVRTGRASHPDGTEVDPERWWEALLAAIAEAVGGRLTETIGILQDDDEKIAEGKTAAAKAVEKLD